MKILLDTHAFLWLNAGDPALSDRARSTIEDGGNERYLSIASIWEIAIKVSLKKLDLTVDLTELVDEGAIASGIAVLDIAVAHARGVAHLPFHHRDPFDRLLIAQAKAEGLAIVGKDEAFDAYGVRRIW